MQKYGTCLGQCPWTNRRSVFRAVVTALFASPTKTRGTDFRFFAPPSCIFLCFVLVTRIRPIFPHLGLIFWLSVLQADAVCDLGFTYNFVFRHEDIKILDKELSPLHNRCKFLVHQFPHTFHRVTVDNLYPSVKFLTKMYLDEATMFGGTCRTWGRGLPNSIIQQEVKSMTAQAKVLISQRLPYLYPMIILLLTSPHWVDHPLSFALYEGTTMTYVFVTMAQSYLVGVVSIILWGRIFIYFILLF